MALSAAISVWRVWAFRVFASAALSPIPGVILAVWFTALFRDPAHGGGVDWSHPLGLVGLTLGAIFFVYLTGGRSFDPVTGFHPMYGWLALGTLLNLLLFWRPWRSLKRPIAS
jgi:hypothetical protein